MTCKCGSNRILSVLGKVDDSCFLQQGEVEHEGYVVSGLRIGAGDYLEFDVCLDCGQMQTSNKDGWTAVPDLAQVIASSK